MLSFHVKFVQTDRRTDGQRLNNMPPIFRYGGIKNAGNQHFFFTLNRQMQQS